MVSRLIRNKYIETQWGKKPLIYLCQSKTDVVARLIAQHSSLTDQEVVVRLREEYDCEIARRTVAYHRGKRLRRNKRRKKDGEEAETVKKRRLKRAGFHLGFSPLSAGKLLEFARRKEARKFFRRVPCFSMSLVLFRRLSRETVARFWLVCLLLLATTWAAQAQSAPASAQDVAAVRATMADLEAAARGRDVNALALFGAGLPGDNSPLRVESAILQVAVSPFGALVRQQYAVSIARANPVVLAAGTQEIWLSRAPDNSFSISGQRFAAPPDAMAVLLDRAAQQWDDGVGRGDTILDLVASRVGGRWVALRSQLWQGTIRDEGGFNTVAARNPAATADWLRAQMSGAPAAGTLTGHFLMQRGSSDWIGVGSAFDKARRISPDADATATALRARLNDATDGAFGRAAAHQQFGLALAKIGLWNESADELRKADLLQPGLVDDATLQVAENNRTNDPEYLVVRQQKAEFDIGLGPDHPDYIINALLRQQQTQPAVLTSLRLALEYSRLGDDQKEREKLDEANRLQMVNPARGDDAAWVQLLADHLRERDQMARLKPRNLVKSQLFTVRVAPGDPGAVPLLAALEEAQHTVYANFGIPMGNTEVLLWPSQRDFANYTTPVFRPGRQRIRGSFDFDQAGFDAQRPGCFRRGNQRLCRRSPGAF